MKKIFTVMMAVAFAFSVAGFALAAEKAAAPAAAPAAEKKAAPAAAPAVDPTNPEKIPGPAATNTPKPKTVKVTGTIEALDAAAGTFTVKGAKGNVDLKAGKKVKLGGFKVGDKVNVKYAGGTASSVKAVKAVKAKPAASKAEPMSPSGTGADPEGKKAPVPQEKK